MTELYFFHVPLADQLKEQSLKQFHQQLAAKKSCLAKAQTKYQTSLELIAQIQQNLTDKSKQLSETQEKITQSINPQEKSLFNKQKEILEKFLKKYQLKLESYTIRVNQLAQNIKSLEIEINEITRSRLEQR